MKITVLCDKAGEIESVAILSAAPVGQFHIEVEGGGAVHQLDVDEHEVDLPALMGHKGLDAQRQGHASLRGKLRGA